eukprot:NP_494529.2 NEPrilysin metallopeptidase family [Caenorhabditis elegans]
MAIKDTLASPKFQLMASLIFFIAGVTALVITIIAISSDKKSEQPPPILPSHTEALKAPAPVTTSRPPNLTTSTLPNSSSRPPSIPICDTPECVTLAHQLLNYRDISVDPCENFEKSACGKFRENSLNSNVHRSKIFIPRMIKKFLRKNETSTSKSENTLRLLYRKCEQYATVVSVRVGDNDDHEEAYQLIFNKIQSIGSCPLLNGTWDASKFNLNGIKALIIFFYNIITDMLLKIAEIGFTNFGFFEISQMRKPLLTTDSIEKMLFSLSDANYHDLDDDLVSDYAKEVEKLDVELKKTIFKDNPVDENQPKTLDTLKTFVPSIDFERLIKSFINPKNSKKEQMLKSSPTERFHLNILFFSVKREINFQLETIIKKTPPNVLANYLVLKFLTESVEEFIKKNSTALCEEIVMEKLDYAAFRVYYQNYFDKENLQIVSDMIDDTKKNFIEMIQESTWLHESTKKSAIRKVEAMKKIVGYPQEFTPPGTLDKLFENIDTSPADSFITLLQKIKRFNLELRMAYVSGESELNLKRALLQVNAMYVPHENLMQMFAPYMSTPHFDSTYPDYAKLATIGMVIGHEMGHGFDTRGGEYDENGMRNNWWTDENKKLYKKKVGCLVEQYNAYDDPELGKNLTGSKVKHELIADGFGAEVAWKAYKKLDLSKQPRLIGFQDFNVDKLFFYIRALKFFGNEIPEKQKPRRLEKATHPTHSFRINGVVSNWKPFAETFNCPVGSPMNPEKKCELF